MKKLIALAASALFSLNASAAYVKYEFTNGPLEGFIIQHDDDRSIALYSITFTGAGRSTHFAASGQFSNISSVQTRFRGAGPTSAVFYTDLSELYYETLDLVLTSGPESGVYAYYGDYSAFQNVPITGLPPFPNLSAVVTGLLTQRTVDHNMANYLDSVGGYEDGINELAPAFVPEPTSLALLAVGLLGAAGAIRRRKNAG